MLLKMRLFLRFSNTMDRSWKTEFAYVRLNWVDFCTFLDCASLGGMSHHCQWQFDYHCSGMRNVFRNVVFLVSPSLRHFSKHRRLWRDPLVDVDQFSHSLDSSLPNHHERHSKFRIRCVLYRHVPLHCLDHLSDTWPDVTGCFSRFNAHVLPQDWQTDGSRRLVGCRQPSFLFLWFSFWFDHQLWQLQHTHNQLCTRCVRFDFMQRFHCHLCMRSDFWHLRIQSSTFVRQVLE